MEAAPPPPAAAACFHAAGVEILGDRDKRLAAGDAAEDLPHDFVVWRVEDIVQILVLFVAERKRAVCDLTLHRVVHEAAADVLGHIFAVKLVYVHHRAQREPSGGRVIEILLGVKHAHAEIVETGFVHHRLQHISTHPVRLPRDDVLKLSLFRVLHHPLEVWAAIRLSGDGPVLVRRRDADALRLCENQALAHLLLDTGVLLSVAAVAGIDDADFRSIFLRMCSFRDRFTSGVYAACQTCPEVV